MGLLYHYLLTDKEVTGTVTWRKMYYMGMNTERLEGGWSDTGWQCMWYHLPTRSSLNTDAYSPASERERPGSISSQPL